MSPLLIRPVRTIPSACVALCVWVVVPASSLVIRHELPGNAGERGHYAELSVAHPRAVVSTMWPQGGRLTEELSFPIETPDPGASEPVSNHCSIYGTRRYSDLHLYVVMAPEGLFSHTRRLEMKV